MNKFSVVIAEDEQLLLENLAKKIEKLDLNLKVIGTAPTGTQAYDLISKFQPDILISDIRMPSMNGIELLTRVHEEFPFIRLVIISSYSEFEYAKAAISIGVSDYLLKPIETEVLKKTMSDLVCQIQAEYAAWEYLFTLSEGQNTPLYIAEALKNYIQENYSKNINLNIIAAQVNYSPSYLTKIFSNKFGCTPSKYIITLRIQKAKQMLYHYPHVSIQKIGETVGYPDQGYFSRIFKKYVGKGPMEYRAELQIKDTECKRDNLD